MTPDARALVDVNVVDGFGLANALCSCPRVDVVDGFGLANALMAPAASVRSTAASPLLAFLRGVPSVGSSLGVPPAISGSLTPTILADRGGIATS